VATQKTVEDVFALVYFKFPNRKPTDRKVLATGLAIWESLYAPIPDAVLSSAAARWVARTIKLYPDDDPFAQILQMAQPTLPETSGDCMELALEAIGKFGRYHEDKAMAWLKEKSPLVAATVRRFGFVNLCDCENLEVARGQMKGMFAEEKARAATVGEVIESAQQIDAGKLLTGPQKFEEMVTGLGDRKALPGKVAA